MTGHTVYAVASGKGGVGKTTTTINVGTRLTAQGERVVVVDTDLGMANLDTFLGLDITGPTLHDVLADEAAVADALYDAPGGMDVLPSGATLAGYADVETESLGTVVETLREQYDYVLLDVGGGVSHESVLPLGLADAVALITTPDVAAIRDTIKTREIVTKLDGDVLGVIVTRAGHGHQLDADDVSEELSADLLAVVPEDEAVSESLLAAEPVVEYDPESSAAVAYSRLADAIAGTDSFPIRVDPEPTPDGTDSTDATAVDVARDDAAETTAERVELDVDDPGAAPDELLDSDRQDTSSELFQDEDTDEPESEAEQASETAEDDGSVDSTAEERPTDPLAVGASEHTAGGDTSDGGDDTEDRSERDGEADADDDSEVEDPPFDDEETTDSGDEGAVDEDSEPEVERVDVADDDPDIPDPADEPGDSMGDDGFDSGASGSESDDSPDEDDSSTEDEPDDERDPIAIEPTDEFEGDEEASMDPEDGDENSADEDENGQSADDDEPEIEESAEEEQPTDAEEEPPTDADDDELEDVADSVVVEDDGDGEPIDVEMAGSDQAPFRSETDDESDEEEEETDDDGLLSRFFG